MNPKALQARKWLPRKSNRTRPVPPPGQASKGLTKKTCAAPTQASRRIIAWAVITQEISRAQDEHCASVVPQARFVGVVGVGSECGAPEAAERRVLSHDLFSQSFVYCLHSFLKGCFFEFTGYPFPRAFPRFSSSDCNPLSTSRWIRRPCRDSGPALNE